MDAQSSMKRAENGKHNRSKEVQMVAEPDRSTGFVDINFGEIDTAENMVAAAVFLKAVAPARHAFRTETTRNS